MKTYLAYVWQSLLLNDDDGSYWVVYAGDSARLAEMSIRDMSPSKLETWQNGKMIETTYIKFVGGKWSKVTETHNQK